MELRVQEIIDNIDKKLQAECARLDGRIPYMAKEGRYLEDMRENKLSWWTNGFFVGMNWQMYQCTGNPLYMETARKTELELDEALRRYVGLHHDVGFQFLHTAVADYRLTGNEESRVRGLHAANLMAGRFNPAGNYIRAWNGTKTGWMIVDCLMNIPLLYWAAKEEEDPRYSDIADRHAHTALESLQRKDGSCNHIAVFDPANGELLEHPGGQGYGEGSSWSRGQAWAVYGLALAYLHTKKEEYLDGAKRAAHYFISNAALTGYVSLVDFRAPKEPVYWDTSATACAACGLLQIAEMVPELEKPLYYESAVRMLEALEAGHCDWDPSKDGILLNGTGTYGKLEDTHVSLIYGDYFFVEGILRLAGKGFMIW
ncbi:MAG: glycoside hydrolase family 88 protein [Clostridiaceae bacterium]|nr:glycoside hydrolase family 88 protein [Clostridiaceae bacterium]